jgi:hypothetical protein
MPADPTSPSTAPNAKSTFNVIGILPGHDPILKNEAIVIGAHYDHLGHGGSGSLAANSTEIHHGADDNASGTAAVIELARQFAKEKKNKRTIIFMAFSAEEDGLFGSKYYVNNPVWPLDKTIAMINLDMVGRLNENKLNVGGIGTASEWKQSIKTMTSCALTENGTPVSKTCLGSTSCRTEGLTRDGFGHPTTPRSTVSKFLSCSFSPEHTDYHKPSDFRQDQLSRRGKCDQLRRSYRQVIDETQHVRHTPLQVQIRARALASAWERSQATRFDGRNGARRRARRFAGIACRVKKGR